METQRHQDDLDILKDIKSDMQEFRQQTQQQFRQVFHLIEEITVEVNSLKHHANLPTSPIRNLGENIEQGCAERVETINDPQTAHVNEEFQMQEILPTIEGIISYFISLFCTRSLTFGSIIYRYDLSY